MGEYNCISTAQFMKRRFLCYFKEVHWRNVTYYYLLGVEAKDHTEFTIFAIAGMRVTQKVK